VDSRAVTGRTLILLRKTETESSIGGRVSRSETTELRTSRVSGDENLTVGQLECGTR
jgi:hypothetical protein